MRDATASHPTVILCPVCTASVTPVGGAWKCQGKTVHYFGVYRICGECGYSSGHGRSCTQPARNDGSSDGQG